MAPKRKRGRPKGSKNKTTAAKIVKTPGKRGRPKRDEAVKELLREMAKVQTKLRKLRMDVDAIYSNAMLSKLFGLDRPARKKNTKKGTGKRGRPAKAKA